MAYRNLTFRSLASDIRVETYMGDEHLVIPCIALVGDEVVYGMNADGPEFIPAEELELSTLGWGDRPVLYDHPPASTTSACEPRTLEAMSFGRTFFPRFEDNKLKLEAWCNKRRAKEIGQEELLDTAERGEMIELSVGAIITLIRHNGVSPGGKSFIGRWAGIQSDHLAIGLSGSQGACNIEMGCGANRVLKSGNDTRTIGGEVRTMRAMRGEIDMGDQPQPQSEAPKPEAAEASSSKPQSRIQKILSYASRIFRSNTEDEGLSDFDLRSKLWDVLYSIEPAFSGIEDVYQDSKTVRYITNPTYPEHKMYLWRRTFDVAEDGTVTVNDDREEVDFAVNYIYLGSRDKPSDQPCGCQTVDAVQTVAANETNTQEENADMPDDPKKPDTETPAATPTPASTPSSTPAATPSTTSPAQPATDDPKPADSSTSPVTSEQLKALLEDHPVVKHYRAQEARERSSLIAALAKKQSTLSQAQLETKSIEDLRTFAEFLGIGAQTPVASGDFSGRMMADATEDAEIKPVPKSWDEARKLRAQKKASAAG